MQFFTRLGLPKLRFKPAYNPYTEPSMEIFSYSEQLKKWMEVCDKALSCNLVRLRAIRQSAVDS
jgi:phenylalanyl-tRNA synthetase alpha subunit